MVTARNCFGAGNSSPKSIDDGRGADNVSSTGVDACDTRGARDKFAAIDGEAVQLDIPMISINKGQENGSTGELGRVTAADGDLRVVTGAFGAAAEVERELLGGDLALGNSVLKEGVGLALGLAETETHEGVGGDVGRSSAFAQGDNLGVIDGDTSNGDGVEEVLTGAGATAILDAGGVVLIGTLLVVAGRTNALVRRALGSRDEKRGGARVELDGEALLGSANQTVAIVVVIVAVLDQDLHGLAGASALLERLSVDNFVVVLVSKLVDGGNGSLVVQLQASG